MGKEQARPSRSGARVRDLFLSNHLKGVRSRQGLSSDNIVLCIENLDHHDTISGLILGSSLGLSTLFFDTETARSLV